MTDKPRIILEGKSLGEYFEQAVENKKLKDKNWKLIKTLTEIKEIAEIRKDDINDWLAKEILQKISEVE